MTCQPTATQRLEPQQLQELKAKYRRERDKRLTPKGQDQYVRPANEFASVYTHDPFTPVAPRKAISEDLDVAILGAGWTGVLAAYHLKQAGVHDFRNIDHAGDFGGVWYWNRYPGVQCDNDAYCYLPLLEETGFMPSKKFADGYEIYDYFQLIAERFELRERALFHTLVTSLRWDESIRRWRVTTNRGDELRARHVIMAGGLMNMPKLPGIPGIHDFKGKMFHTARWDYEYTGGTWRNPVLGRLADKRVAIIGTGATAIQAIPYLAKYAKHLYVLQRTPPTVDERPNPPTDPAWVATLEPGWQKERQANFHRAAQEWVIPGEPDLVCDIWTEINRNLAAELAAEGWPTLSPEEFAARRERVDFEVMERLRARVDALVMDRRTAAALKPWFRFICKRPLSNNEYYPTFNRPNVTLIDVSETQGVEALTAKGFMAGGIEHEVDCIVLASGFEVTSDLERRWGIDVVEGRNGVSIYDHWREGPRTLHGVITNGFPNMYYTGFIQGATNSSTTEQFRRQCEHIAYIIEQSLERRIDAVEPTVAAVNDYCAHMQAMELDVWPILRECTPGYYNNDGEEKPRWALIRGYKPGWDGFMAMLKAWREGNRLEGLVLTAGKS